MSKRSKFFLLLILLTIEAVLTSGCVRRRMTVRSNPPGATVYLDGKEIGRTPLSTNFDFYGKREFRLVKEGYQTRTDLIKIPPPWYQWIGIDFFAEVLLPGKLTDHKSYEFDMQPDSTVLTDELIRQAESLRRQAHAEGTLVVSDNGYVSPSPMSPEGGSIISTPETPGATVYQPQIQPPTREHYIPPALPIYDSLSPSTQQVAPSTVPSYYVPPL